MRYGGESARGNAEQRKTTSGHIEHQTSYTQTCFFGGLWFDANLYVFEILQNTSENRAHFAPTKDRVILGSRHRPRT